MSKVIALKNIYKDYGKNMKPLIPKGIKGEVIDRYEWGPHRYIVVKFDNNVEMEFGDGKHPLTSYKGFIEAL